MSLELAFGSAQQLFSRSYDEARARFRGAAQAAGMLVEAHPLTARGPDGEELSIDVARTPLSAPHQRALVISSGMHGVEGYFGSALQLAMLEDRALLERAQRDCALVFIHALNPYGFAHRRRCNEEGVDLNRNFVRAGFAFAGAHPAYRRLDAILNPKGAEAGVDMFFARAALAVVRSGYSSVRNAIAQGQYDFPQGLFFGGSRPSESQRILRENLPAWIAGARQVVHLDLHTGVGKWATYALCTDLPDNAGRVSELKDAFGAKVVQGFNTQGVMYEIRGALGPWLEELVPDVRYDCLLAEFGTYPGVRVLSALRFDNRVHQHRAAPAERIREAAERMMETFCPSAPAWRHTAITRGLGVVNQALRMLSPAA